MPLELIDEMLSNGVRVITERNSATKSMSLGMWVDVGSRDEGETLWGCSHFIEHLLFKGTETRSAKEISSILENRGGYLNAFTDRDMTAYHARVLSRDQDIATELLSDMLENSLLREADIEMERGVVLEEIKQVWDDLSDLIHDLYAENIWRGYSVAHPIIGNFDTISNLPMNAIRDFYHENYAGKLVVVGTGAVNHENLVSDAENFIKRGKGKCVKDHRKPEHFPGREYIDRDTGQVQLSISTPGYPYVSDETVVQTIISSYLGVGASSLLFQEIRERRGLAYNVYSYNQTVKHKTIGLFILGSESNRQRMHQLGLSTLRTGKPRSVEDVVSKLEAVTNEDIQRVADEMFDPDKIAITILGMSKAEAEVVL
jgi:predicted Zn-dependent peptidase